MTIPGGEKPLGSPDCDPCGDGGVENGLEALLEEESRGEGSADNDELLLELESAKVLVERLSEENKALGDAIARARADFFNYRQRVEREQERLRSMAGEDAAAALIPVLDNLDRALSANRSDLESFVKGVGMVRDQFFSVLEDLGVSAIETVGKPFDPSAHEAVAVEEAGEGVEDGIITEELQTGYTISGKVLRAARVKVARAPS